MKKTKILIGFLIIVSLVISLSINVFAEGADEASESGADNNALLFIIAGIFAILAVTAVLLVNRKTKKYRQAFKKRKKRK